MESDSLSNLSPTLNIGCLLLLLLEFFYLFVLSVPTVTEKSQKQLLWRKGVKWGKRITG